MLRSFFKPLVITAALVSCGAFALQPVSAQQLRAQSSTRDDARGGEGPRQAGFIDQETLLQRLADADPDLLMLDVRTPDEYAAGHIAGAINIAYDQLPARAAELASARDKDIVLYCRSGRRTAIAVEALRRAGFTRLLHLDGDMLAWQAARRPLAVSSQPAIASAPADEDPKL